MKRSFTPRFSISIPNKYIKLPGMSSHGSESFKGSPVNPTEISPLLPTFKQPFYTSASTVSFSSDTLSSRNDAIDDQSEDSDIEEASEETVNQAPKQPDAHKNVAKIISVLLIGTFGRNFYLA